MKFNINKITPYFGLTVLFVLVLVGFTFRQDAPQHQPHTSTAAGTINWMTIEQAEAACKKEPRKIVIDVYTSWCGWCKKMDATTFADPAVGQYISQKYYAVKMDAEDRNNIIFKEKLYKFNTQQEANELAISLLNGNMSYPTTVYLDEKLQVIQPIGGYLDAREFNKVIHYFGDNSYRKKTFEVYKKELKEDL